MASNWFSAQEDGSNDNACNPTFKRKISASQQNGDDSFQSCCDDSFVVKPRKKKAPSMLEHSSDSDDDCKIVENDYSLVDLSLIENAKSNIVIPETSDDDSFIIRPSIEKPLCISKDSRSIKGSADSGNTYFNYDENDCENYGQPERSLHKKYESSNKDSFSVSALGNLGKEDSFKLNYQDDYGNTSVEAAVNDNCVNKSYPQHSSYEKLCKVEETMQNLSLCESPKHEGESVQTLSPLKSFNESIYFDNAAANTSYFDEEMQLAVLESLKDNSKEQTAGAGIQSPLDELAVINVAKRPLQAIISKREENLHSLDLCEQDRCSENEDYGGNKENLIAEKMRLEFEIMEVCESIKNKKESLKITNLDGLPDKGMKLKISLDREERSLDTLKEQLHRVSSELDTTVKKNVLEEIPPKFSSLPSANIQYMGEKALETHRVEKALTVEALANLHESLNTCPSDDQFVHDPDGLKINLMDHQKQALAWLMWRESAKPSGGILADDMGLGKTLTMISLVLKKNEEREDDDVENDDDYDFSVGRSNYKGGTLVVCPLTLIGQWESEITRRVNRGLLSYEVHHGPKREKKAKRLAKPDIVITSYSTVLSEFQNSSRVGGKSMAALFSIKWKRIILDEAHVIRNHKSKTANGIFGLRATYRWALTGTPVHNKTLDFYSLMKFIRCKPFDDLGIWKKWVEAKDEAASKRLNTLTKSLMLRRTKDILMKEGKLKSLPDKSFEIITLHLDKDEFMLYEEVSKFSKTLLARLLCQMAEKEQLLSHGIQVTRNKITLPQNENPFSKHPALNRIYNRVKNMENVKTYEVLVLLLRLRQICCHPALMKSMIEEDTAKQDGIQDEDGKHLDMLEISGINFDDEGGNGNVQEEVSGKNVLDASNDIFKPERMSSKIKAIFKVIEEIILKTEDKIVIVSQWTSMLDLIYDFLKTYNNCNCERLTGKVPVDQRTQVVSKFNKSSSKIRVLLLSLTAGGTGLNLVGGNHLILTDLHWNPQLEAQACDRIYRMGQTKPVKIYKFVCAETVEETILNLQNVKLALADGVLSGFKQSQAAKLTLNDLKMLFNVK